MAGSYWHHLQLIDKLEIRDDCWLCEEPVLGSRGYKCGECSFIIHESCSIDHKIEATHDLSDTHHLISMKEEAEKNGDEKKVVVCSLCQEPVSSLFGNGPTFYYKCSFPNCTFLLHQPCAQLPYKTTHPLHFSKSHNLRLYKPQEYQNCCGACGTVFSRCFFYGCQDCFYTVDAKCDSRWRNICIDKCNPHALSPIWDLIEFTCKACGVKCSDIASHCSNCLILIHTSCVKFLGTIKIRGHDHSLTCTFSLNQVKKNKCEVCYEDVDTKYAAYCCDDKKCDYIAHLRCAYWLREESEASHSIDYATHLVEGINLKGDEKAAHQEIKHPSHPQHKLILKNEELLDVKRCEGCMQFIVLPPFYDCAQCNYSLHIRCSKLPQEVMRPLHHEHLLTLHNVDSRVQSFKCSACNRTRSGFTYRCALGSCQSEIFDAQCTLIPEVLKHKGHQHWFFLGSGHEQRECNACGQRPKGAETFDCNTCGFRLCIKCATLPLVSRHRYDTHILCLTYDNEDKSEEYYCQICEKEKDEKLWFYYCKICDFVAHPQCILGRTCFD